MAETFDLIVIGTGSGGSAPAYRCRAAGWRVAVVDELPYGGTCALRGCDPKKVLVGAADLADWNRRMQGRGVSGDAHISWPELMQFKRTFTDPVPADREKAFQKAGIATYHGPARFVSPERLSVDGQVLVSASLRDRRGSQAPTARGAGRGAPDHEHRVPRTRPAAATDRVRWCRIHLVRVRPRGPAGWRSGEHRRSKETVTAF